MIYDILSPGDRTPSLLKASPKGEGFQPSPSETLMRRIHGTDATSDIVRGRSSGFRARHRSTSTSSCSGIPLTYYRHAARPTARCCRSRGPHPCSGQLWDPTLTPVNRRNVQILAPDLARVSPDGNVTFQVRRFAEFASPLDLRDFPFDEQVLRIDIASTRYGPDEVELVVDNTTSGRLGDCSLAGWNIELGEITVSQIHLQGRRAPRPHRAASQRRT